jgi:hypothetical protein
MPPVRLPSDAELARDALAAPLFARAVRLARWAGPTSPVGAGGELLDEGLREAVGQLGLTGDEDGPLRANQAWRLAVGLGLVEVEVEAEENGRTGKPEGGDSAVTGTAVPGEELGSITAGSPRDVLDIWLGGLDTVLDDAAAPCLENPAEGITEGQQPGTPEWDRGEESGFLDGVLGNLYLLTVLDEAAAERAVPLPALAASVIVPEDMSEPTDDILEQVSEAMMRLDDRFRLLAPLGVVDYQPVDEALIEEIEEIEKIEDGVEPTERDSAADRGDGGPAVGEEDVARFGLVRLTPLGVYGVRARMLAAGIDAPAVGDLAGKDADTLLDLLPGYPEAAARSEIEQWLARREPAAAARELLAAGRGDDEGAPLRRLGCQQALSLIGPEAEPALREVLDDRQLGGLARVWLSERGATGVPEPSGDMIFWLTVDTIAARLGTESDVAELAELVQALVGRHRGFFATAWRIDHPATAEVLEAMSRLHPDRKVAKEARTAAFKARSGGSR